MTRSARIGMLTLFFIAATSLCHAHKVSVFAWVEGDTVYTESSFMGGKKPKDATIIVYDKKGEKLLEGKTNDKGEFSFKAPVRDEMKVVLVAGMGHQGDWTIRADEFSDGTASSTAESAEEPSALSGQTEDRLPQVSDNGLQGVSREELRQMIDAALDKKLHPVVTALNELKRKNEKVAPLEMMGAIGYIIGLVGLGAYVNYRKVKK